MPLSNTQSKWSRLGHGPCGSHWLQVCKGELCGPACRSGVTMWSEWTQVLHFEGLQPGAEDCRGARLAECKGPARRMRIGHLTPNIGQLWMMHMLSLRKVWYWALQCLLDSSETSVYSRVVDILAACGELFLPSTAVTENGKEGVSSMCTRQLLFFYPIFCCCTAPAAGRIPA